MRSFSRSKRSRSVGGTVGGSGTSTGSPGFQ